MEALIPDEVLNQIQMIKGSDVVILSRVEWVCLQLALKQNPTLFEAVKEIDALPLRIQRNRGDS